MRNHQHASDDAPTIVPQKQPHAYRPPVLTAYGSIAKLTQGGSFSDVDGQNTMMIPPPGQMDMLM